MKQLTAEILANEKVGAGFYRMRLASAYLAKASKPGQFIEIRCSSGKDPLLRRPLGVHRIWSGGLEILYEVVGKGTELLSERTAGGSLDIIGPLGNGFDTGLASATNILVAGGIGAAPLVALAESLSAGMKTAGQDNVNGGKTYAIIGARTASHVMCEKEFRALGCVVKVSTDDGSKGSKGLVTEPLSRLLNICKIETYLPALRQVTIYACGPSGMLKAVSAAAIELGISCQVSLEDRMACGVGVCMGCPVRVKAGGYKMVCKDGPVFNAADIAW